LQSKNLQLKNGTEAAISGVFVPRKLRKAKTASRFWPAQGIEAEIPEACRRRAEELERIARFFAPLCGAKNAPKY
jgi:hypothetical protein